MSVTVKPSAIDRDESKIVRRLNPATIKLISSGKTEDYGSDR
jgi:hypothetical protein